jgi:hypothetical protein
VNLDVASVTDPAHRKLTRPPAMMAMISSTGAFRTPVELAEVRRRQLREEQREQQQSGDEREQYQPIPNRSPTKAIVRPGSSFNEGWIILYS